MRKWTLKELFPHRVIVKEKSHCQQDRRRSDWWRWNCCSLHAFALIPHKAYCMREYKSFFLIFVQKVSHIVNEVCWDGAFLLDASHFWPEKRCSFHFYPPFEKKTCLVCDQHQASGWPWEEVAVDNWWWPAVPVVIMYECLLVAGLKKHSHSCESYHSYR